MGKHPTGPSSFGRDRRIWTGERVPLTVPLAGFGERAIAYLVDVFILIITLSAVLFIYAYISGDLLGDWRALNAGAQLFIGVLALVSLGLYDILFEIFLDGQSPGKRLVGLRVITGRGTSPTFLEAAVRNVMRLIDWLPFLYGVGTVTLFVTGTRRLGDLIANTYVVTERARQKDVDAGPGLWPRPPARHGSSATSSLPGPFAAAERAATSVREAPKNFTDDEVGRALALIERAHKLNKGPRDRQAKRFLERLEIAPADDPFAHLAELVLAMRKKRTGLAPQIDRAHAAERRLDAALKKRGDRTLDDALELDDATRHAVSELMRSVRRRVPTSMLERLSLALLDAERRRQRQHRRGRFFAFIARDLPASVWRERRLIQRAAAVLVVGTILGFALAYVNPAIARYLLGPDLAGHIEDGARWTDQIEQNGAYGAAAMQIIINNVKIAWIAFILGLVGGMMPILALGVNGMHFGAVFGYAFYLGTHATLGKFILAHGPVEMTAICVAAAAGICLGRALLTPGDRTRLQALRQEAALGLRMTLAATVMLGIIGLVEGFVSPGATFPIWVNASVGLLMWGLFFSWVWFFGRPAADELEETLARI